MASGWPPGRRCHVAHSHGQSPIAKPDEHNHAAYFYERRSEDEMAAAAAGFHRLMLGRRSLRFFSPEPVPVSVVEDCIRAGGTSPSGAHCQPWKFLLVQTAAFKEQIRALVEEQEAINYDKRMKKDWVDAVAPMVNKLHSDGVRKEYLTEAPYIVVMMKEAWQVGLDGERIETYYPEQSIGIAAGIFLCALHVAGLTTLTSTPLGAESGIRALLGRPEHEKVYLLMPIGRPSQDATVPWRDPAASHKPLDEIMTLY